MKASAIKGVWSVRCLQMTSCPLRPYITVFTAAACKILLKTNCSQLSDQRDLIDKRGHNLSVCLMQQVCMQSINHHWLDYTSDLLSSCDYQPMLPQGYNTSGISQIYMYVGSYQCMVITNAPCPKSEHVVSLGVIKVLQDMDLNGLLKKLLHVFLCKTQIYTNM